MDPRSPDGGSSADARLDEMQVLRALLQERDKAVIMQALEDLGWTLPPMFHTPAYDADSIKEIIRAYLAQSEKPANGGQGVQQVKNARRTRESAVQGGRWGRRGSNEDELRFLGSLLVNKDLPSVLRALRDRGYGRIAPTVDETELRTQIQRQIDVLKDEKPSVTAYLTDFGERARDQLADLTEPSVKKAEVQIEPTDPRLESFKSDFDRGLYLLDESNKAGAVETSGAGRFLAAQTAKQPKLSTMTWEEVVDKLNNLHWKNPEKSGYELALALKGGGELIGVDKEGRLLFRDRVEDRELPYSGLDYSDAYEAVYGSEESPTGYELFPKGDSLYQKPSLIRQYEKTKGVFLPSSEEGKSIWLDNGRDARKTLTAVHTLDSVGSTTTVSPNRATEKKQNRGALRLLRV